MLLPDQQVFGFLVRARKLVDDVADVRADSEIAGATDIDGNTHRRWRSAGCAGTPCQGRRDVPAPVVERKLRGKLGHFGANAAFPLGVPQMRKHVGNPRGNAFHVRLAHPARGDRRRARRMPPAVMGGVGSKGIEFLLTVMPARSSAGCASFPVMPREYRSIRKRWLSVPPV